MRSEKRLLRCTRQIATCKASFASRLATPRWPTASPAVWRTFEEAATPGQPGACRSTLLEEPSQPFTLENRWAPPALPQCSGRAHRTSRSMSALCASHAFASSKNPSAFVQKLWMPPFPCGSSWKSRTIPLLDFVSGTAACPERSRRALARQLLQAAAAGYRCVILRRNPCARCTNPVRGKNINGHPSTTLIPCCLQNATASSLTAPVPLAR
jgi:hypothetical protein